MKRLIAGAAFALSFGALRAQVQLHVALYDSLSGGLISQGVVLLQCEESAPQVKHLRGDRPVSFRLLRPTRCMVEVQSGGLVWRDSLWLIHDRFLQLVRGGSRIAAWGDAPRVYRLKEAVVEAVRGRVAAAVPTAELSGDELAHINTSKDLPMLLERLPSVVATSDAGMGVGYTAFRVRGVDPTRINVTINGVPLNDAESHGVWWVDLPDIAASVDRLQLQRGLGPATYGGGGLGANLHLTTEGSTVRPYASLIQGYGSFNTLRTTLQAATGRMPSGWGWTARASRITSDGFIDRAFSRLTSYYTAGEYLRGRTRLHFIHFGGAEKTYQAWYGVPIDSLNTNPTYNEAGTEKPDAPYDNETDNYWQYHWQAHLTHQTGKRAVSRISAFYVRGYGYYEQYKAGEARADYGATPLIIGTDTIKETDLIRRLWLDNHFYGLIASHEVVASEGSITWGGGMHRYLGGHYGEVIWAQYAEGLPKGHRWYDLDAVKDEQYAFLKAHWRLRSSIDLTADAMLRRIDYRLNGFRDNPTLRHHVRYLFPNPRVGIVYRPSEGLSYRLFAGWGHKEPNRDDFEAAENALPRPEQLFDIEAGGRWVHARGHVDVNLFAMEYRDQLVLTGRINDVGAYVRENVSRSHRRGIEIEGRYEWPTNVAVQANLTYNSSKIARYVQYIDDWDTWRQDSVEFRNVDIAFSPRWVGAAVITYRGIPGLLLELEGKYVGAQYLDNTQNDERRLPPYFVPNLRLRYRWTPPIGMRAVTVGIDLFNLRNKVYSANGWTYLYRTSGEDRAMVYVYPQAPFHAMVHVRIDL